MDQVLYDMIKDTPLPRLVKIRQRFDSQEIADVEGAVRQELKKPGIRQGIRPGMKIAVGVGSRGIAQLPLLVRTVVDELKKMGAEPFIVPAMGSHGGATAEGQQKMLADLGVTEAAAGCPIRSSMEVEEIGELAVEELGRTVPVHMDRFACQADGIVIIARVKPHTGFRAANESGLAKMLTIGLGKQKGASTCHRYTYKYMGRFIREMARMKIERCNVLFALGVVENAYDHLAEIKAVPGEQIIEQDAQMLRRARQRMAGFLLEPMDVLVVGQVGKNVSGDGMDPNITGRWLTPFASGGPRIGTIAVLDLTKETHGNAVGIGGADLITRRLYDQLDLDASYANALTVTNCSLVKIPVTLDTDRNVIKAAVNTSNALDLERVRLSVILDTMHMNEIYISESMLTEAEAHPDIEILSEPREMCFDETERLLLDFKER